MNTDPLRYGPLPPEADPRELIRVESPAVDHLERAHHRLLVHRRATHVEGVMTQRSHESWPPRPRCEHETNGQFGRAVPGNAARTSQVADARPMRAEGANHVVFPRRSRDPRTRTAVLPRT